MAAPPAGDIGADGAFLEFCHILFEDLEIEDKVNKACDLLGFPRPVDAGHRECVLAVLRRALSSPHEARRLAIATGAVAHVPVAPARAATDGVQARSNGALHESAVATVTTHAAAPEPERAAAASVCYACRRQTKGALVTQHGSGKQVCKDSCMRMFRQLVWYFQRAFELEPDEVIAAFTNARERERVARLYSVLSHERVGEAQAYPKRRRGETGARQLYRPVQLVINRFTAQLTGRRLGAAVAAGTRPPSHGLQAMGPARRAPRMACTGGGRPSRGAAAIFDAPAVSLWAQGIDKKWYLWSTLHLDTCDRLCIVEGVYMIEVCVPAGEGRTSPWTVACCAEQVRGESRGPYVAAGSTLWRKANSLDVASPNADDTSRAKPRHALTQLADAPRLTAVQAVAAPAPRMAPASASDAATPAGCYVRYAPLRVHAGCSVDVGVVAAPAAAYVGAGGATEQLVALLRHAHYASLYVQPKRLADDPTSREHDACDLPRSA